MSYKLQQAVDQTRPDAPCISDVLDVLSEIQKALDEVSAIADVVDDRISGPRPVAASLNGAPPGQLGRVGHLLEMAQAIRDGVSRLHNTVSAIDRATS